MEKIKINVECICEVKGEQIGEGFTESDWVADCGGLLCGINCPFYNQKKITRSAFIEKYKQKEV